MAGHQQTERGSRLRDWARSAPRFCDCARIRGIEGSALSAVSPRDPRASIVRSLSGLRRAPPRCCQSIMFFEEADIVLDLRFEHAGCVPSSSPPCVRATAAFIVSVGALLEQFRPDRSRLANAALHQLFPTGAPDRARCVSTQPSIGTSLYGQDGVRASRVAGLKGAPFIAENNIDIDHLREATEIARRQRERGGEGLSRPT